MVPPTPNMPDPRLQEPRGEGKRETEQRLERQLDDLKAELDRMWNRIGKAGEDVRRDLEAELERSEGLRRDMEQRLEAMRREGEETWREMQHRVEETARELKRNVDKMVAKAR